MNVSHNPREPRPRPRPGGRPGGASTRGKGRDNNGREMVCAVFSIPFRIVSLITQPETDESKRLKERGRRHHRRVRSTSSQPKTGGAVSRVEIREELNWIPIRDRRLAYSRDFSNQSAFIFLMSRHQELLLLLLLDAAPFYIPVD